MAFLQFEPAGYCNRAQSVCRDDHPPPRLRWIPAHEGVDTVPHDYQPPLCFSFAPPHCGSAVLSAWRHTDSHPKDSQPNKERKQQYYLLLFTNTAGEKTVIYILFKTWYVLCILHNGLQFGCSILDATIFAKATYNAIINTAEIARGEILFRTHPSITVTECFSP